MSSSPHEGETLAGDRYRLESLIAKGGMGEVWRARHTTLKSAVAIKLLHTGSASSPGARRRFLTEAQVTASLRSRHAVQVFDFGVTTAGVPYLVMELLEGETLHHRIARLGRLSSAATTILLRQASRALDRAHKLGIVHRDFKPENVILARDHDEEEEVKIVDFGIAKIVGALEGDTRTPAIGIQGLRGSGTVGTPFYMAPEQIEDASNVGPATDIWAFGVVAYECLTGRRPFDDERVTGLIQRILLGTPVAPASMLAPVPLAFDDWFRIACAVDPTQRFADAGAAALALATALGEPLTSAEPATDPRVPLPVAAPEVSPMAATFGGAGGAPLPLPPAALAVGPIPPIHDESSIDPSTRAPTTGSVPRPPRRRRVGAVVIALGTLAGLLTLAFVGRAPSRPVSVASAVVAADPPRMAPVLSVAPPRASAIAPAASASASAAPRVAPRGR